MNKYSRYKLISPCFKVHSNNTYITSFISTYGIFFNYITHTLIGEKSLYWIFFPPTERSPKRALCQVLSTGGGMSSFSIYRRGVQDGAFAAFFKTLGQPLPPSPSLSLLCPNMSSNFVRPNKFDLRLS